VKSLAYLIHTPTSWFNLPGPVVGSWVGSTPVTIVSMYAVGMSMCNVACALWPRHVRSAMVGRTQKRSNMCGVRPTKDFHPHSLSPLEVCCWMRL